MAGRKGLGSRPSNASISDAAVASSALRFGVTLLKVLRDRENSIPSPIFLDFLLRTSKKEYPLMLFLILKALPQSSFDISK